MARCIAIHRLSLHGHSRRWVLKLFVLTLALNAVYREGNCFQPPLVNFFSAFLADAVSTFTQLSLRLIHPDKLLLSNVGHRQPHILQEIKQASLWKVWAKLVLLTKVLSRVLEQILPQLVPQIALSIEKYLSQFFVSFTHFE